jgi:hypothetical protein
MGLPRTAGPSWRALTEEPFWDRWPVVIATNAGPRPSYEVWVHGKPFATRPSLAEAKEAVERKHGAQEWTRVRLPKIEVEHYYFGPTTEFTDPITLNVVEGLAVASVRNRLYACLESAQGALTTLADYGYTDLRISEGGTWALLRARKRDVSVEMMWEPGEYDEAILKGVKVAHGGTTTDFPTIDAALAAL